MGLRPEDFRDARLAGLIRESARKHCVCRTTGEWSIRDDSRHASRSQQGAWRLCRDDHVYGLASPAERDICEAPTCLVIAEMRGAEVRQDDVIELKTLRLVDSARTPDPFSGCSLISQNRFAECVLWITCFLRTKTSQYSEALAMTDGQPVRRALCDVIYNRARR